MEHEERQERIATCIKKKCKEDRNLTEKQKPVKVNITVPSKVQEKVLREVLIMSIEFHKRRSL